VQANELFTVKNVRVDATAENAITARNKAFEDAQLKAFDMLAKRMLEEGGSQNYNKPDADTISTLIKDYEVTKEKLSAVRYIGTYTFTFNENGVRRIFQDSGQAYTTVQSKPLLVLPYYKRGNTTKIWSENNVWMQAWARSKGRSTLLPLVVPLGDVYDIGDLAANESLSYNPDNMRRMLARYEATDAVMIRAAADQHLSLVDVPNQPATGTLTIEIFQTDQGHAIFMDNIVFTAKPDQTLSQMMDEAVKKTKSLLQSNWKKKTQTRASQKSSLQANVPIAGLADWSDMQSRLASSGLIQNIILKSLSSREAQIQIDYQGTLETLSLALDQQSLSLSPVSEQQNGSILYLLEKKRRAAYDNTQRSPRQGVRDIYGRPDIVPADPNYSRTF